MIGLPSGTPIYLYTEPIDFRKGFDGLTGIVTTAIGHSVTEGALFLFVNGKQDRIKAIWWEAGGLTLWYRRLGARKWDGGNSVRYSGCWGFCFRRSCFA